MKKYFWALLLLTTIVSPAFSCSSFVLKNGDAILVGKNFDWTFDQGYLIKNIKNTEKTAYYTHSGTPVSWTSKYGSITFNQNGKEMPYGGMNERGLVVEMLWLDNTRYNISEEKDYLNELEWIQYQLDNFHTVDEVIDNIESLKIYPIKGKIHYILADAAGKSVIIEYLDGKPQAHKKEPDVCQAITNKTVAISEKYVDDLSNIPKKNTSEIYRYHQLEQQIKKLEGSKKFTEKTAFKMLQKVSIPKGSFKTVWSVVYDINERSISFFSHGYKKVKQVNFSNVDFERGVSYFDINQDKEIVLDDKLKPLTAEANSEVVSASLNHLGFDEELGKELSRHQMSNEIREQSHFSQNYFHFNIRMPLEEANKRLLFAVMDSPENFDKRKAVTGGYVFGLTSVGTFNCHIYGLKNGTYSMIALIDGNRNSQLDFDDANRPVEQYATFSELIPKSMAEITFENTSGYFTRENARLNIDWR